MFQIPRFLAIENPSYLDLSLKFASFLNKSLFMFVIQVLWSHSKVIITGGKNLNVREQKVGIIVINALIAQD